MCGECVGQAIYNPQIFQHDQPKSVRSYQRIIYYNTIIFKKNLEIYVVLYYVIVIRSASVKLNCESQICYAQPKRSMYSSNCSGYNYLALLIRQTLLMINLTLSTEGQAKY